MEVEMTRSVYVLLAFRGQGGKGARHAHLARSRAEGSVKRHEDGGVRADGDQARAAPSLAARCARSSPHWPHGAQAPFTVLPLAQFGLVKRMTLRPCTELRAEQVVLALGSLAALCRLRMGRMHLVGWSVAGWSVAGRRLPLRMAIQGRWLLLRLQV